MLMASVNTSGWGFSVVGAFCGEEGEQKTASNRARPKPLDIVVKDSSPLKVGGFASRFDFERHMVAQIA